jgi:predicted transglutaminase-like cysteine proteinase
MVYNSTGDTPNAGGYKMSSITIDLPEEHLSKLREIAGRMGVSVEDLARMSIEELLAQPKEDFGRAADYVLNKNAELYRRLA